MRAPLLPGAAMEVKRIGAAFSAFALGIQTFAHFLARLEIGHALGVDRDRFAGPRIAADARIALAGRKSAKAAKLDTAAMRQLFGDGIENGADNALDLTLREVGKVAAKLLHEFGPDHLRPRERIERASDPPSTGADETWSLSCLEIAGDPQRVSEWLGETVEAPLEDVKVEWVAPNGTPGLIAVQVQTPTGLVRI